MEIPATGIGLIVITVLVDAVQLPFETVSVTVGVPLVYMIPLGCATEDELGEDPVPKSQLYVQPNPVVPV